MGMTSLRKYTASILVMSPNPVMFCGMIEAIAGGDDVVAADALDPFELVLGGEVPHRDDLHVLFPSVRDVQEHVPEVADAPGVLYGVLDRVLLRLLKLRA